MADGREIGKGRASETKSSKGLEFSFGLDLACRIGVTETLEVFKPDTAAIIQDLE